MKSVCIKTNDTNSIKYLLNELEHIDLENICFTIRDFKHYKNIIIHYSGTDNDLFLRKLSNVLSFLVVDELEDSLLNKLILQNYLFENCPKFKQFFSVQ